MSRIEGQAIVDGVTSRSVEASALLRVEIANLQIPAQHAQSWESLVQAMPEDQILVAAAQVAARARANLIERYILPAKLTAWNEVIPLEFRCTGAAVGANLKAVLCQSIVTI